MKRLTHLLVLAAFLFSCGGQWYALQCIAWVKMIHDYSQSVPLAEAVGMTFSGKYPCAICKAIADKKQSETNKICAVEKYGKKFFSPQAAAPAGPSVSAWEYPAFSGHLLTRAEPPSTPPPRTALS